MRIATFNANSIRSRLPIVLDWLTAHQPDILCVQETKAEDKDFPAAAIQAAGYCARYRGEKSYNGVAILSRREPDAIAFGFDDGGPVDAARLAYARFGSLHVINTYVPQGREIDHPMYAYKQEWLRRLGAFVARRFSPRKNVLWCGDLNVAPDRADIHNADQQENHVCYHADVRKVFAGVLAWGFTDIYRRFHPEPGRYTFFDYRTANAVARNMGWRIDHLLTTPPLAAKATDAWIDLAPRQREKPSDHTFLAADFALEF
jgi:exodeoxyribonuclease III